MFSARFDRGPVEKKFREAREGSAESLSHLRILGFGVYRFFLQGLNGLGFKPESETLDTRPPSPG